MDSFIASLLITQGTFERQVFRFREAGRCVVGRGEACQVALDLGHGAGRVSRRHCLFVFDPPWLRVCDLGSLNGTFVNGRCIGQRPSENLSPASEDPRELNFCELQNGDVVCVGHTIIRVVIARATDSDTRKLFPESVLWM